MMVLTPTASIRFARSSAPVPVVSTQPFTATLPSFASIPTAILSPNACTSSATKRSLSAARVPITTRLTPKPSARSTAARVRRPPPSSTFIPIAAIACTSARFCGSPAKAPSRSTTWTHALPAAQNCAATSAGFAAYTVSWSARPWSSRTARPPLMSMAG